MKNNRKLKITMTVIICILVSLGITIGVGCYNYYVYDEFKIEYLDDYFNMNDSYDYSNQEMIERANKWESYQYIKHPGSMRIYDPGKLKFNTFTNKVDHYDSSEITNSILEDENSIHKGAKFENGILHLPEFFDLELYQTRYTDQKNDFDKITYNFYVSNIKEYKLRDRINDLFGVKTKHTKGEAIEISDNFNEVFDNIYISFVPGTSEESLQNLEKLKTYIESDNELADKFELGSAFAPWTYSYSKEEKAENGDINQVPIAYYALFDNVDEKEAEKNSIIRYNALKTSDQLGGDLEQKKAEECDGFSFVLYYCDVKEKKISNEEFEYETTGIVLLSGTFEAEKVDGNILNSTNFDKSSKTVAGYQKLFYQDSFNSFIKHKQIVACSIAFAISLIVTGFLGFIWTSDIKQNKSKQD